MINILKILLTYALYLEFKNAFCLSECWIKFGTKCMLFVLGEDKYGHPLFPVDLQYYDHWCLYWYSNSPS